MTFYQKQALADDLRRKWRNDNGYLSMFDRPLVKNMKERAKTAKQKKPKGAHKLDTFNRMFFADRQRTREHFVKATTAKF